MPSKLRVATTTSTNMTQIGTDTSHFTQTQMSHFTNAAHEYRQQIDESDLVYFLLVP